MKRTERMDLDTADNEWVKDRGDGALLDRKESHNRVVEEDIRVARTSCGNQNLHKMPGNVVSQLC